MRLSRAAALAAVLTLAACATQRQPPGPPATPAPLPTPAPAAPTNALAAGVELVAPRPVEPGQAVRALQAFRASCPVLLKRSDSSGLTMAADWTTPCAAAATVSPGNEAAFFQQSFDWVRVGDGKAFATGYYEPEIRASRVPAPGYSVPIYIKPDDLVRDSSETGNRKRVRIGPDGVPIPYYSRSEIEDGALAGRGLELAWAADPIELFFLQVQGSGRLRMTDGSIVRIGYADQNGLPYVAIGKLLRDRSALPPGGATMDGIVAWMRAQPDGGRSLMRENPSYVFFRELTGPGPLGAMGVAVTPRGSVAADPRFVPLGAPVFLDLDSDRADGLWVAQDTGGAIKGANRFDTFWGAGDEARSIAGSMSSPGRAWILLPRGALARAIANARSRS